MTSLRTIQRVATLALLIGTAAPAAAQPQIQPTAVKVVNSPNAIAWPVTTRIQRLELLDHGVRVTFDRCSAWPDVTPPGWEGPLRFTLWLLARIGDEWYASGIIQFWGCDQLNGGAVYQDNQIARNWVYDARWSAMVGHQPVPGERIGFMVSSGNARGEDDHLVAERSDIVEIVMPAAATSYPPAPFAAVEGTFVPPPPIALAPPVVTPPVPAVVAPPSVDPLPSRDLLARLDSMDARLAALQTQVAAVNQAVADFREAVRSKWIAVMDSPIVKYGLAAVAGFLATHKWGG